MPGGGLSTGALAGVVLALIFFVLVVTILVAILIVYFRHRTITKSYEFDVSEKKWSFIGSQTCFYVNVAFSVVCKVQFR